MKTLVIHPIDASTDFLQEIYLGRDWTIVRASVSKSMLKQLMNSHDRIVMLGHGTDQGLIDGDRYVIDCKWVDLLRQKECVCVWCNADQFVSKYKLSGIFTGMIISEDIEANMYCINASFDQMQHSNKLFADTIKTCIDSIHFVHYAKSMYHDVTNPVINFNRNNMFKISRS